MKVHSVLFKDFVDIFLKEEFESAIAASRNAQRRDDLGLVQHAVVAALNLGRYTPEKPRIVEDRSAGKVRRIAVWPLRERMVMRALHRTLAERLNQRFLPGCIGGVKGRSRHDALKVFSQGEAQRRRWALVADVANFFASVDQEKLGRQLAVMHVPEDVRRLVLRFVGDACPGAKGIPLGASFSKLLGNVCLHPVDLKLAQYGLPWCRFVDDILVLARSRGEAQSVLAQVRAKLGELGLEISEPKTGIAHRYRGGIDFLGFRAAGRAVIPSSEVVERFVRRLSELHAQLTRLGPKKALVRWNRTVLVFGHMYKTLDVRKLFRRLDGVVRLEYREHLRSRGGAVGPAGGFSDPSRFPPIPATWKRTSRNFSPPWAKPRRIAKPPSR